MTLSPVHLAVLAGLVLLAGMVSSDASVSAPPPSDAAYKEAPLEWKPWPPPAKYARFADLTRCVVVRLPEEQSFYCPPRKRNAPPAEADEADR